ncbi:MAG: DNA polymerase III subunit alpha, partial [Mycoplasmatota bacterium]
MTPLYIKTSYSLLQSMIDIKDLIKYAKLNNIHSLAITDPNMYGAFDFYKQCVKNNIKPIIGLEVTINEEIIVLYAKNYDGYKSLLKISTMQSEKKLKIDNLNEFDDLIAIVPYKFNHLFSLINYKDKFIGYSNLVEKELIKENKIFLKEVLYLNKEDSKYIKYLYGIKDGITIDNVNVSLDENYIGIYTEENNIANLCNVVIKKEEDLLPRYETNDSFSYLKEECIKGLKKIFGNSVSSVYQNRLKYELDVIKKLNFCDYFLIVQDYVRYAKENDILVGPGRGSAAGSLVSYLLNITTIDPIKYDLLFERFLNEERVTMPDIDIDFEYNKREDVVNYCIKKYTEKKVAPIITFGTLAPKQAIRDVGRVMNIKLETIDLICKNIDSKISLKENLKNEFLKSLLDDELKIMYKIACKFEGLKRHTSIHAAGIVMSVKNLDEVIPLDKSHEFYTTGYSMEHLEELGLLKMDFLGLKNLSLINECLKDINIDFDDILLNDKKTFNIFKESLTIGIFQFESDGMMNFLKKFKPDTFADITAAIALFRPGPMDNIDTYIKRSRGLEKVDYIHPDLESILKPTYGIIVYQEQIMQISSVIAGYSYSQADILRRAMSKKKEDVMLSLKEEFINKAVDKGYTYELANKVFDLILKFCNYGFNKAHAVSYAMIAYKMAYIKAHYPNIFLKNLLTMNIGNSSKTKEYIYEAKILGANILSPDINNSSSTFKIKNNSIYYPLTNIKNVGINAAVLIEEELKKGEFENIFDFAKRCYGKAVNKKTIESLIYASCFKDYNKKTLINNLDKIINYSEIGDLIDSKMLIPELSLEQEYSKLELMKFELDIFGFYLTNHPVTDYKLNYKSISVNDVKNYFDKVINIVVMVDRIKEIKTKKEEVMAFLNVSDEIESIDCVVFPTIYNQINIKQNDILLINAKVEKRYDSLQL